MAHPRELIDRIVAALEKEYPPARGFTYALEKMIPGTRMLPDVLIRLDGRMQCAVEIGYTRPEKLTAYRQVLKIPDVRWYDKAGNLHGDVQEKVVRLAVSAEPAGDVSVYQVWDQVFCEGCPAVFGTAPLVRERYERRFGPEALFLRDEQLADDYLAYVWTWVVTDHITVWYPSYCDKCGVKWFGDPFGDAELLHGVVEDHRRPRDLAVQFGRRDLFSWSDIRTALLDVFDLSLDFFEGYCICSEDRMALGRAVHVLQVQAR